MSNLGWDEKADVVVVGGGGAGLRAGLAAATAGAKTMVLEKTFEPGGKTAMSIGIMTASGTSVQRAAGVKDSHARHLADVQLMAREAGAKIDVASTKFMMRVCSAELENLIALGVEFSGPHPEGPHGIPRMHVIQPDCRHLVKVLEDACIKKRVRIQCNAPGAELILDHRGRIAGVRADTDSGAHFIEAGAVVLAAGDYSANTDMVKRLAPKLKLAQPLRDYATGDGHRMAMRIGARVQNMARVNLPQLRFVDFPFVEPSPGLIKAGARLVTGKGERIKTKLGESILMPGFEDRWEEIFIVIDAATAAKLATAGDDVGPGRDGWARTGKPFIGTATGVGYAYLDDCRAWDWHFEAKTIAAAARHIGARPASLAQALANNAKGPLHVLGPARRVITNSGGGVATNQKTNVIAEDGGIIKGLFGAGVNARLISFMGGHGYALAWAMASGRIAGGNAARHAKARARKHG
ncbi:MAG: FAD-dependent oxidoreductase [Rhodospirillales bacterium]|jgi:fumarate reductase flavoprotein subunit|nr:FAD-dependent oxidoreductase [Rhodospirillales bacterium]MDP6643619.1 FAD-dependent oxidoreductase [Rhodospirillales bacterium]MDP6842813.1 FAD-dependent oxidoreductase [Rhodospirillales bacterium]